MKRHCLQRQGKAEKYISFIIALFPDRWRRFLWRELVRLTRARLAALSWCRSGCALDLTAASWIGVFPFLRWVLVKITLMVLAAEAQLVGSCADNQRQQLSTAGIQL